MSRTWTEIVAEDKRRKANLEASNERHQDKVERPEPDYPLATCSMGHDPVKVLYPDECAECYGDDPWCEPFCPICDFCGGC